MQRGWSFWNDPTGTQIVVLKAFCYAWFDVLDKSHLMVIYVLRELCCMGLLNNGESRVPKAAYTFLLLEGVDVLVASYLTHALIGGCSRMSN